MVNVFINVHYAQHKVGVLSFDPETGRGYFEYTSQFVSTGLQLSPLMMPLRQGMVYSFPHLRHATFRGLPGMLADSLPDDFGNAVLNAWVASQGKDPAQITPLQRLQYTGSRGMGALEFRPAARKGIAVTPKDVALEDLVRVVQEVIDTRTNFEATLAHGNGVDSLAMQQLMQVGMSAGGARPKAVLAFDSQFCHVKSGQVEAPEGWSRYLLKFDGVKTHRTETETFGDPLGYGAMEYVYYLMATAVGINMSYCRLLEEGARRHFLTQRFDRIGKEKVHIQTLNAMQHVDYKMPGTYSYHEIFQTARQLALPIEDAHQILLRMIFNIVARNHDDHPKNWAFTMDNQGTWRLSPAYDLAFSYKHGNKWINSHWMTLNGKRDDFTRKDLHSVGKAITIFSPKVVDEMLERVVDVVSTWPTLARDNDVPQSLAYEVGQHLRLSW